MREKPLVCMARRFTCGKTARSSPRSRDEIAESAQIRGLTAAAFDSLRQPLLDFALEPADRTLREFDSLREALFRLHPINHRATSSGPLSHLRPPYSTVVLRD